MAEAQEVKLARVAGGVRAAEALRLVRDRGGAVFVVSETTSTPRLGAETAFTALSHASPGRGWNTIAVVWELVPARLGWDVSAAAAGGVDIAYEKPGGALNALVLREAAGSVRAI